MGVEGPPGRQQSGKDQMQVPCLNNISPQQEE